jgi:outer membrane immunogenic protein
MKKLLLAGIALAALGNVSALAADLPVRRAAPAPVPYVFNWSGFYIGGHVGGGWSDRCLTLEGFGEVGCNDASGIIGGGQVGFNWQTGNNFVFGIEFSGSIADINGDNTSGTLPGGAYFSSSGKSLLMLTGRVGMSFDRALFYVTGGGAWARNSVDFYDGAVVATVDFDRQGWTIGAGLEYAFTPNWSIAAQYNYVDLGDKDVYFPNADLFGSISQELHLLTVRLNYRFGGGGPVVARN